MEIILSKMEKILVEIGVYPGRRELIEDALRALLREKPELKFDLAVELYKRGEISLSRAAEVSGLNLEDFKELLKSRGVKIPIPTISTEEIEKEAKRILEG